MTPRTAAAPIAPRAARCRLGGWRRGLAAACVAALLPLGLARATAPAGAEDPEEVLTTTRWIAGDVAGLLSRPAVATDPATGPGPIVILLSDGPGVDGRADVYARRLLGVGIAVLDADFGSAIGTESAPAAPHPIPAARRLDAVLSALADDPEIDPARIVAVGIGEGARVLLLARAGGTPLAAAVLLYPGCDAPMQAAAQQDRSALAGLPVLLMHGDADPVNLPAACAGLAAALGGQGARVSHRVLRDATYAWDMPRNGAPGGSTLLPDPTGAWERLRAEPDAARAEVGADRVLSFLLPVVMPRWQR